MHNAGKTADWAVGDLKYYKISQMIDMHACRRNKSVKRKGVESTHIVSSISMEGELNLKLQEWGAKARISRGNANSRRYSASYIREDARSRSLRTNTTISSTASSPGNSLTKDEIDPSTYSFTTALRALQARSGYNMNSWECAAVSLNSKWNEAEKYICNPLSGQFPLECLSAKTLSNRITISAPLFYPCRITNIPKADLVAEDQIPVVEKTRDAGTQSTPPAPDVISSGSPSPASTPSILDTSFKRWGMGNGGDSTPSSHSKAEDQVEVKETEAELGKEERIIERQQGKVGCLSISWMRKRQPEKQKSRRKRNFLLSHFGGC